VKRAAAPSSSAGARVEAEGDRELKRCGGAGKDLVRAEEQVRGRRKGMES